MLSIFAPRLAGGLVGEMRGNAGKSWLSHAHCIRCYHRVLASTKLASKQSTPSESPSPMCVAVQTTITIDHTSVDWFAKRDNQTREREGGLGRRKRERERE